MPPPMNTQVMKPTTENDPKKVYEMQGFEGTPAALRQHRDSLTSMFERYLEQQSQNPEDITAKCGIIFMSGASPLTFALEEAQGGNNITKAALHDAGSHFSKGDGTKAIEGDIHPSHLSSQDITYLKDKGAFERPKSIHRINTSTSMGSKRRSLLKRLFWALAVRDAYCAALLGRPFRLNIAQCDTEPLNLEDFDHDENCSNQDHTECLSHGHYQIQVSKLSLILRKIVEAQFGPSKNTTQAPHLHHLMDTWQSELPPSVSWWQQQSPTTDIFAMSLKIIFHQQLILIHLKKRDDAEGAASHINSLVPTASTSSSQIAESAAQIISSTAFTIMANSMLGMMPHEIFSGFFVAGIVFYRGIKQPQDSPARLSRSALDNCQMVISEARERWDLATWVMRIFDFLLSTSSSTSPETATQTEWTGLTPTSFPPGPGSAPVANYNCMSNMMPEDDILHSTDFGSPTYQMGPMANEFFLMSNYLPVPSGDSSFMSM
ncbi:hypothetical protein B0A49_11919 [Cryomyces minteri]|uniref:Transcription factor domain-containing protein n=1 Tax=Cryomyces minteri TaxID=331657 RepID=A0A4U0W6V8_9PEZI|nr:hypothetical protein B0A49_11919 [Cryomyces minteri]